MSIEQSTSANETPLVSAIVSTYNAERFIRGCLEDLEAQTIADRLEIVVIDSGSPQNEWSIVREFQQRYDNILYIRTAQREGLYAAWNRGIQAARGKYITNANTDDRHKRDAFERMVAAFETRPDIALIYANAYITTIENETFENHTLVGELNWPGFDPLELIHRCYIGPQPMWRKRMHTTYGYFDESFESAGDWDFWLRLAENETFLHLPEFLGVYLHSPTSVEHRNYEVHCQEMSRVQQRYLPRADRLTKARAVSGATVTEPMTMRADQPTKAGIVLGTTVTEPMSIKAYKLYDHAAILQPAHAQQAGEAALGASSDSQAMRAASGIGGVLLCPQAFEATWNGGPNPEDIDIRLDAPDDDVPAFVQSHQGGGQLTLYTGYQLQTTDPGRLWVRGPINRPKDGLYPLEQMINTVLPATITLTWAFTRPHQTVRFEAGEPFGAIVPYPGQTINQFACDVVEFDNERMPAEYVLQQLVQAPEIQAVFQRLQNAGEPAAMAETLSPSNPNPVENAPLAVVISVRNRAGRRVRNALRSLAWQTSGPPAQVIVVSSGSRAEIDEELAVICAQESATLLTIGAPGQPWNKSLALNTGIRATRPEIPYLMTMDVDMILAPNFLAVVIERLQRQPSALVLCQSSDLPEQAIIPDQPHQVLEAFQALHASSSLRDRTGTGGIQAAHRSFFFEIRGYDEDLIWWGAEDGDVVNRALRVGLALEWIEDRTAMLHQWHPRVEAGLTDPGEIEQARKAWGRNHDLVQSRSMIIQRNPEGWGCIAETAADAASDKPEIQHPQASDESVASPAVNLAAGSSFRASQLTDLPPVSCICPTYGRVELLEEAIYCFLLQDYPGPKELIVLNDYMEQTLVFDHPEVRVINLPKRFRTLGEKRSVGVALASHNLLFPWDDDDIYLPHRLSYSMAKFDTQKGFFKPSQGWYWANGHLQGPAENRFHANSCWSRKLFDSVRGYGAVGSGEDMVFEQRLEHQFPGSTSTDDILPEAIYYLYRWNGTGSYHLSQFGDYQPGSNLGHHEVEEFVQQRADRGEIRQGRIPLQPHWKTDYQQLVSSYIATLAAEPAPVP